MEAGAVVAERFEIERLAGSGGMGEVWAARDRLTGDAVAVKVLVGQKSPDRFLREASLLSELAHPGIVRYVAHGLTPTGQHYLVMEWLDGEDLADRLARKGLTVHESVLLARKAAEALAAAHARGVVHRDVKPSNLFLVGGDVERVKVLDFGVARRGAASATRAATQEGALLGTPGYIAPEQALGEGVVDARADVFSIGCVLFECVTGRPAFMAESFMGILAKIVLDEAPRASEVRPDLPPRLDDLLARMLAKDPAARPESAAAVALELSAIESSGPRDSRAPPSSNVRVPGLGDREQRLVSVVVAGPPAPREHDEAMAATVDATSQTKSLDRAREAATPFGARFEALADGSLIGTIATQGTVADQAAQAARCALAVHAHLPDARVVLATGRSVAAGRLPMGEVIDRATRLLRVETRGAVRIDEATAALLDARFDVGGDDAGLVLRGAREHVEATRNLLGKPSPCVGRDRELRALEDVWRECVEEPVARVALVTGPAGIGKSRLRFELLRRVQGAEVWIGRGDPMRAGSPFAMLAHALRRAAGLRDGEPRAVLERKLRARVARHVPGNDRSRVAQFLGELVGVPFEGDVQLRAARQDAVVMGDQMRRAFEDLLDAETRAGPLLFVLEDLHWGDLPTVRFVDAALRALADRPFMVLALARPDVHALFPRLWSERRMQELRLEELTKKSAERLVREVLGERATPAVIARIVERAGGNAFYLEELMRGVAEGKGDDALPDTVLAMAQARLDALEPEARRILRAASVFGETFWVGGVVALLGGARSAPQADEWLDALVAREVVSARDESKFQGERELTFRHALVREAAYASLTDADKKLGHRLAAEWLEQSGERDAMLLAEHAERGGETRAAVRHYLDAAESALRGNDLAAALARAERGIACGAEGETKGALALVQAEAHRWVGEFHDAEARAAIALAHLPPRSERWFVAAGEVASAAGLLADRPRLLEVTKVLEDATRTGPIATALVVAAARAAVQLLHLGEYAAADALLARIEAAVVETGLEDPAVRGWLGRARTIRCGKAADPFGGRKHAAASAASLEAAGDLRTACLQRMNLGYYLNELGAYEEAETALRASLADAARIGLPHVVAPGKAFLGYALGGLGRHHEAVEAERDAALLFAAQGDKRMEAASRNHLSRSLRAMGDVDGAEHEARRAVGLCDAVPAMRATALGELSAALLARGDAAGAREAAERGMKLLAELGSIDQGEPRLRLAHAISLDASGDRDAARAAIVAARTRVLELAQGIADDSEKKRFLERVPENGRTMKLAADWLGGR